MLRRYRQEVRAVLPLDAPGIDQPQVDLVDQRRCLQRVVCPLGPHVAVGQPAQFGMNQGDEFLQGGTFPAAPR